MLTITIGVGGGPGLNGGDSWYKLIANIAHGGTGGVGGGTGGVGGSGNGGGGGAGGSGFGGGGGGGSAGAGANGGAGGNGTVSAGGAGGTAGTGGVVNGAAGGAGAFTTNGNGNPGVAPGGGGGAAAPGLGTGGSGANGRITLTWTAAADPSTAPPLVDAPGVARRSTREFRAAPNADRSPLLIAGGTPDDLTRQWDQQQPLALRRPTRNFTADAGTDPSVWVQAIIPAADPVNFPAWEQQQGLTRRPTPPVRGETATRVYPQLEDANVLFPTWQPEDKPLRRQRRQLVQQQDVTPSPLLITDASQLQTWNVPALPLAYRRPPFRPDAGVDAPTTSGLVILTWDAQATRFMTRKAFVAALDAPPVPTADDPRTLTDWQAESLARFRPPRFNAAPGADGVSPLIADVGMWTPGLTAQQGLAARVRLARPATLDTIPFTPPVDVGPWMPAIAEQQGLTSRARPMRPVSPDAAPLASTVDVTAWNGSLHTQQGLARRVQGIRPASPDDGGAWMYTAAPTPFYVDGWAGLVSQPRRADPQRPRTEGTLGPTDRPMDALWVPPDAPGLSMRTRPWWAPAQGQSEPWIDVGTSAGPGLIKVLGPYYAVAGQLYVAGAVIGDLGSE
jgi:hypothetical protein